MNLEDFTDTRCRLNLRRAAILDHPTLNGIDFVEYFEDRTVAPAQYWLEVNLLKSPEPPDPTIYGLVDSPERFRIEGGVRTVGIEVTAVTAGDESHQLEVFLTQPGDFSTYVLVVDSPALDRQLATAAFSFKAGCPSPFDCRQEPDCPPNLLSEPALDYLAKDYSSFRQLMLDLIPQRNPRWLERYPADLGIVLVELMAYVGDHLSYFQDAVATEAYLDTARHRVSAKRHVRLVDYQMHDGRNAWGYVHLEVTGGGGVPQGTQLLTRITQPLQGQANAPGPTIAASELNFDGDRALQRVSVFETTVRTSVSPRNNEIWLHTWGDRNCCLPKGATGAYLYGIEPNTQQAIRPPVQVGDFLLLEEVKGATTGNSADADPSHRQVVQLIEVQDANEDSSALVDSVFRDTLILQFEGNTPVLQLQPVTDASQARLPLVKVRWRLEDALNFPLCISAEDPQTRQPISHIAVARGNVIPCDEGRTVVEELPLPKVRAGRTGRSVLPLSSDRTLTFQAMPPQPTFDNRGRLQQARPHLEASPREVQPAVVLFLEFPAAETEIWQPAPHLLDSQPFDRHFVVDVDNDGRATLQFGDGLYGRQPLGAERAIARYRIGTGREGNLGSGSLVHIVRPPVEDMSDPSDPDAPLPLWPEIVRVWQPLPMVDGTDPESIETVRQLAPRAFHAEQFRAVTEADYVDAALKLSEVAAAKSAFRWTGSWHTVFVAIHPRDPQHLIVEPGGRTRLDPEFAATVQAHLTQYKLAGYDLKVLTGRYIPLEIEIQICVALGHFRGDVLEAVHRALSNRLFPDGATGFFHPSQFVFGQDVFLSRLYAAVERVEGVDSAQVTVFQRYWDLPNKELQNGVIPLGEWEIARLDNDPSLPENGVLTLTAVGGL